MEKPKKEPWRILVGILSFAYILFLWVKKDILSIYAALPPEEALPLAVTTVVVSIVKVLALTGALWLMKWSIGKIKV